MSTAARPRTRGSGTRTAYMRQLTRPAAVRDDRRQDARDADSALGRNVTLARASGGHRAGMGRGLQRVAFGICVLFVAVVVPVAWLVGAWWLGPRLDHANVPFATPLLLGVVVVGVPV